MVFSGFLKRELTDRARLTLVLLAAITALVFFGMPSVTAEGTADPNDTSFTFAQVPDTQKEVHEDDNPLLPNRYQWLADNKDALNLKFVSQTGDLVDWGVVEPVQFTRASAATTILDNSGVPYSYALGNHDGAAVMEGGSAAPGNTRTLLRDTTLYNQTFPLSRFKNVGGTFEPNKVDNMYQTFTAGGLDWLVLSHEMWPRDTVIQWMKQVVASHPTYNVVVTTHAFIDNTGSMPTTGNYGDKNAQYEWDNFISKYPNIKMVLSGHYGPVDGVGGYYYKESTGVNGNKVAQIMTAYHSPFQNHVRLLHIDTANNSISSSVWVNLSLDPANYPSGDIHDSASDFVATNMNWIRPAAAQTAPEAPQSVVATGSASSASVSFAAPANNGGSAITGYTVTASPGGATATGSGSPIVVNGLIPGNAYTFTVTATNYVGTSISSAPSNSITVTTNPELLSDPGFEAGNGGWKAFDTGTLTRVTSPVYSGARALQVVRSQTTATKTGITLNDTMKNTVAGTTYTASCYVRASVAGLDMNARFLEYSQNYATVTSFANSGITLSSLPANSWQLISFTATAVKNGERLIPQFYSSNQYTSTGSILYDGCSFKVGTGEPVVTGPTEPQEPVLTAPAPPQNVTATAGIYSASVSFAAPASDGGSAVTSYTVTTSPSGPVISGQTSPILVSGLTAGTAYTFAVTATNAIGTSVSSAPTASVTPLSLTTELLADPGFESGTAGWKAFDTGTLTRVTSPVYSGTRALQVVRSQTTATKTGITLNDTMKTTVVGKTYTASCYVRASVDGLSLDARFLEYSQNYATVTSFPATAVSIASLPANTWQFVTFSATAVKNSERMIPQFYSSNQYTSTGSILYDGCSFTVAG